MFVKLIVYHVCRTLGVNYAINLLQEAMQHHENDYPGSSYKEQFKQPLTVLDKEVEASENFGVHGVQS